MSPRILVLCLALLAGRSEAGDTDRPNVLLMIADDQGWADLSCMGIVEDVKTPRLDALAGEGVRFERAYAGSPICNVSRSALITGCYPQRFGSFWYGGKGIHDTRFVTLSELFDAAGYDTAYVGKFHYGAHKFHQPGQRSFPLEHGFDSLFGFSGGRKHYLVHEAERESGFMAVKREHERKGQSLQQGPFWEGDRKADVTGFSTELLGERARAFLAREREEPFFLVLSFNAVHNFTHQLPADYLAEHGLGGYRDWDPATEDYYEWYRAGRKPNNPEGRAHYLGQLHFLDREVGLVLDELERLELDEETVVVYVGDNGGSTPIYADNGPLRGSKYTLYEGGVRVPLLVRWPGHAEAGAVRDEVVSVMDLYPTLALAAGIPVPEHVDGHALGGLLDGVSPREPHEFLAWDTGHESALLRGHHKLKVARSNDHAIREMVEVEVGSFLYDLEADPGEEVDLSSDSEELHRELVLLHASWRASLQD